LSSIGQDRLQNRSINVSGDRSGSTGHRLRLADVLDFDGNGSAEILVQLAGHESIDLSPMSSAMENS
jgi:hypothetical protein